MITLLGLLACIIAGGVLAILGSIVTGVAVVAWYALKIVLAFCVVVILMDWIVKTSKKILK